MSAVMLAWLVGAIVFPDTAGVYLLLQRSYIDAHWRVDPVTQVTYFPIAFESADESGRAVVPSSFFVLDKYSELIVGSGELVRPRARADAGRVRRRMSIRLPGARRWRHGGAGWGISMVCPRFGAHGAWLSLRSDAKASAKPSVDPRAEPRLRIAQGPPS